MAAPAEPRRLARWGRVREGHATRVGGRALLPTAHFRLRARPPPRAVVVAAASDAAHTTDDAARATTGTSTAVAADASVSVQVNPRQSSQPTALLIMGSSSHACFSFTPPALLLVAACGSCLLRLPVGGCWSVCTVGGDSPPDDGTSAVLRITSGVEECSQVSAVPVKQPVKRKVQPQDFTTLVAAVEEIRRDWCVCVRVGNRVV